MNKLTDIIKRNGIQGCLQKVIFRIGKSLGITYIQYLAYFKNLPETIDADLLPSYQKMTMNDFKSFIRCGYIAKIKLIYKQTEKNKPLKRELIKV